MTLGALRNAIERRPLGIGAAALLLGELDGLGLDFTFPDVTKQARVKDTQTGANNFDGDPFNLLTYTSPSVKLTRQSDGIFRYGNHNLLQQSQAFDNAYWTKSGATVSADSTTAPDGTTTADTLIENAANSSHYMTRATGINTFSGTLEVYAKAKERTWVVLATNTLLTYFDLANGVMGTNNANGTITSVGNGWYLCTISVTDVTASIYYQLATGNNVNAYVGDNASGAYFWGAQLKRTPVQEPAGFAGYLATTTVARYALSYEWDASGNPLGMLAEPAVTNGMLRSQEFDNAAWTKSNLTATANTDTAPDGTVTADTLAATAGNGYLSQNYTNSNLVAGCGSIFLKRKTGTGTVTVEMGPRVTTPTLTAAYQRVEVSGASTAGTYALVSNVITVTLTGHNMVTGDACAFDATSGTAADGGVAAVTVIDANSFTFARVAADTSGNCNIFPRTLRIKLATSGDEVYAWQGQVCNSNSAGFVAASSPIVTTSATVTRAVDDISLATSLTPISASQNSIYIKFKKRGGNPGGSQKPLAVGTDNNNMVSFQTSALLNFAVIDATVTQATLNTGTAVADATHKLAARYAANDFAFVSDLTLTGVFDTAGTVPAVTTVRFGSQFTNQGPLQGYLQHVVIVPRTMTNVELQARVM